MPEPNPTRRRRRRTILSLVGAMTALVLGTSTLWSAGAGAHGRWSRSGGPFAGDPEAAQEHARFMAAWMLDRVDASDEQQEQAQALVAEAAAELLALGRQHRENRGAFLELLSRPALDRDALEELRRGEVALADRASRRLVETLSDVAEVLTPEQRVELAEMAHRFGPRH